MSYNLLRVGFRIGDNLFANANNTTSDTSASITCDFAELMPTFT